MAYEEFFQGFQQLIDGFQNLVNNGILPQSTGIGQFFGLLGAAVFMVVVIFIMLKYIAGGRRGRRF